MIDSLVLQEMTRIAEDSYELLVDQAFQKPGGEALRDLLQFLIELYTHLDPEIISGTLYVVRRVGAAAPSDVDEYVRGTLVGTFRSIDRLPTSVPSVTLIDIYEGTYRVWENGELDDMKISDSALVYRYSARQEELIVRGAARTIRNPAPIHASVYSRPTFSSLREALLDYRDRMVRTSFCYSLRDAWEDDRRLFFRPKPEWRMRRSLHHYLNVALRDAEVRPEQVVDESHPVDLKVTWTPTTREAIIEIKWLGMSREGGKITVRHTESRAREGAKQLAEYLTLNHQSAPHRTARGYLVVIDARRRGLTSTTTVLPRSSAMHYAAKDINYNPEYHNLRDDFDPPIRMFAEPA
jgi:hypothetical protein